MRQKLLVLLFLATIFSNSTAGETPSRLTLYFGAGLAAAPSPDFLDRFWHEGVVFHFGFGVGLRSSFALAFSLTHYTFDYRSGVEPRGDKAGVNVFVVRPEYRLPFGNYRLLFAAGFGFGTVTAPPVFEERQETENSTARLLEPAHQNGGPAAHIAIGVERPLNEGASLAIETFGETIFMTGKNFIGSGARAKIKFTL